MIFLSNILKLHLICSTELLRPALTGVMFDGKEFLYATNGHICLKIRVRPDENDTTNEVVLSSEVFKIISKFKGDVNTNFKVTVEPYQTVIIDYKKNLMTHTIKHIKEPYPNIKNVFDDAVSRNAGNPIGMNLEYLTLIGNAINDRNSLPSKKAVVRMPSTSDYETGAIHLSRSDPESEFEAILMPIRLPDER